LSQTSQQLVAQPFHRRV